MQSSEKEDKQAYAVKIVLISASHLHLKPRVLKRHLEALEQIDTLLNLLLIAKLSDVEQYFSTYFKEPSLKHYLLGKLLPAFFSRSCYQRRSHSLLLEIQERQSANTLAELKTLLGKSFDFIRLLDMMVLKLLEMLFLLRDCKAQILDKIYKQMLHRYKKHELDELKTKLGSHDFNQKMSDIAGNLHLLYSKEEMQDLANRKERIKEILMLEAFTQIVDKNLLN